MNFSNQQSKGHTEAKFEKLVKMVKIITFFELAEN